MIDQMAAFTERLAANAEATGDPIAVKSARIIRRMAALLQRQAELIAEHAAAGREIAELNVRMQTINAAMVAEGMTVQ